MMENISKKTITTILIAVIFTLLVFTILPQFTEAGLGDAQTTKEIGSALLADAEGLKPFNWLLAASGLVLFFLSFYCIWIGFKKPLFVAVIVGIAGVIITWRLRTYFFDIGKAWFS